MKKLIMCSIVFALLPYSLGWSTVINVPGDYPTIQETIDHTVDGDVEVPPAPGIPSLSLREPITKTFRGPRA